MAPRLSLSFCALLAFVATWGMTARAFAAAGSLDPSFSDDGIAEVDFGSDATFEHPVAGSASAPIGTQPNGDLIVAGFTEYVESDYGYLGTVSYPKLNYAALRPDGSLDPSFGDGGRLEGNFSLGVAPNPANSILQSDGKILTGGAGIASVPNGVFVVRLTNDGRLDPTFSDDGVADIGPFKETAPGGGAIAEQSDGKIVVATLVPDEIGGRYTLAVYRLNSDGSPDSTFGDDGSTETGSYPFAWVGGIAVDSSDRILISDTIAETVPGNLNARVAVTRLTKDGAVDAGYGSDGITQLPTNDLRYSPISLDDQDRAYVALVPASKSAAARLDPTGT
jgi:uncharacterized delta-60 repeat protein